MRLHFFGGLSSKQAGKQARITYLIVSYLPRAYFPYFTSYSHKLHELRLASEHKYGSKWWCNFWTNQELCSFYQHKTKNFDIINIIIIIVISHDSAGFINNFRFVCMNRHSKGSVLSLMQSFATKAFSVLICASVWVFHKTPFKLKFWNFKRRKWRKRNVCSTTEHCDEQMCARVLARFSDERSLLSLVTHATRWSRWKKWNRYPLCVFIVLCVCARILMIKHWLVFELHK